MTASPPIALMLPGLHRVRRRSAAGIVEYWYAWRGGPQILKVEAGSEALLARRVAAAMPAAIEAYQASRRPSGENKFLFGLITRYLQMLAEDTRLADVTKSDRRRHLERARTDLGEMELRALESRRARKVLIDWRDEHKATPKTADDLLAAVSMVLQWAVDRGELDRNPVADFPRIYRVDRADIIWEPQHLATLLPHAAADLSHAVRLAALSGLRLGDLITVPWSAVGQHAIVWQTSKSRKRRTIVIPITTELRALLAEIPRRDCVTVLSSSWKRPWTSAGLESAMRRAKVDAHKAAIEAGREASGIEHLRIHDLRGTAATNFIRAGIDLNDVATILGWNRGRVEEIARRYVTGEEIGLAIVQRLRRNAAGTKAVNRPVNTA